MVTRGLCRGWAHYGAHPQGFSKFVRLDAVLGAFEDTDGSYRVLRLPSQRRASIMDAEPAASHGPSAGKEDIVNRAVFEQEGTLVAVVRI
jgi:hypothetical protein